jgi:hypothetical protein
MTPQALAPHIIRYITENQPVTWEQLCLRASEKHIDKALFLDTMQLVNSHRDIYARELVSGMTYSIRVYKAPVVAEPLHYPQEPCWTCGTPMRSWEVCQQCKVCFVDYFDWDCSDMFLKPEEHMKKYGVRHGCHRVAGGRMMKK